MVWLPCDKPLGAMLQLPNASAVTVDAIASPSIEKCTIADALPVPVTIGSLVILSVPLLPVSCSSAAVTVGGWGCPPPADLVPSVVDTAADL